MSDTLVSFNNPLFKKALRRLYVGPIKARSKYKFVANALNIVPVKRRKDGSYTNIPLKEGGKQWKTYIVEEVIRQYKLITPPSAVANRREELIAQQQRVLSGERRVIPNAHKPQIVEKHLIRKVGNFTKYYYRANNVNSLEELYELIKIEENRMGGVAYATLIIMNEEGEFRMISISANNLDTFDDFLERINTIKSGNLAGSDAFTDDWNIILDQFHLSALPIQVVTGKSDSIVWECEEIESKYSYCGYECLKFIGHDYKLDKKNLRNVQELINYIQKNDLKINVLCNSFHLTKSCKEIMTENGKERIFIDIKKRKNELRIVSCLKPNNIAPVYLLELEDATHTIIYDEIKSHFDVMKGTFPKLRDGVKISAASEIMLDKKVLFTPKQININSFVKVGCKFSYIFFDYETVIDFKQSSCMTPYSLSILVLNEDELSDLTRADIENNKKDVDDIRKKHCITFLGYDCTVQFIQWFIKNSIDTTFCFVGFNNSNFDNFLLLEGLLDFNQYENKTEYSVNNVFYNGSQLLNFRIDGKHSLFDIRKHLVGSLDSNCTSFKINCCAKLSFDHSKAQLLHKEDKLMAFITGNDELKKYNEFDVLATAVLFQKYRQALIDIPATKKYAINLKESITIGSLIYKVFKDHQITLKDAGDPVDKPMFGKLSYQHYKDLQKYKIAGRVELFNGVQKINERMASTDVCSLYPYVMAILNVHYPAGNIRDVDEYQGADEIGFYYCDIDQSNLRANNLPKIYARKTEIENDWGHEEVLHDYLISNVMIELLLKYGCKVTIKKGFIFEKKIKSCEMFKFILDMMKAKNDQDDMKVARNNNYNPALRETLKLLMNSLSGKVIEGLHTEKTTDITNMYDYENIQKKATSVNFINAIGSKLFVTYEVDEEKLCETQQRPIFLGVLIYDYSKRYMYENSYSKIGLDKLVYTDTDASKFRYSAFGDWNDWVVQNNVQVPHWKEVELVDPRYKNHLIYQPNSKVFGSFEDELEEMKGHNYKFYCVEKKSWSYEVFNEDGTYAKEGSKDLVKFKFKGINGKAILINLDEPFIKKITVNKKNGSTNVNYRFLDDSEEDVYEYCEGNKQLAIENGNVGRFFDQLFDTGEAYVISNSFRKIVKNSSRFVEYGNEEKYNSLMNRIQVNYSIKHICLKK
ncbi:MAG: hypothetical protein ACRCZ2_07495 [Fusobacteriaceae bacterium]